MVVKVVQVGDAQQRHVTVVALVGRGPVQETDHDQREVDGEDGQLSEQPAPVSAYGNSLPARVRQPLAVDEALEQVGQQLQVLAGLAVDDQHQRRVGVDLARERVDRVQVLQRVGGLAHAPVRPVHLALLAHDPAEHLLGQLSTWPAPTHLFLRQIGGQGERRQVLSVLHVQLRPVLQALVEHLLTRTVSPRPARTHPVVVDGADVEHGVAVGVLPVGVGAVRAEQSEAVDLREAGREGQWVLAPVQVPAAEACTARVQRPRGYCFCLP